MVQGRCKGVGRMPINQNDEDRAAYEDRLHMKTDFRLNPIRLILERTTPLPDRTLEIRKDLDI